MDDRITYIRERYYYCKLLKLVFNRRKGEAVRGTLSAGPGRAPVKVARGEWFLRAGDDPWRVGRDRRGQVYAIYEPGGPRVRIGG